MKPSKDRQLSGSSNATIHKYHLSDGSYLAGKIIPKNSYKHWRQELEILRKVGKHHENVIRYFPMNANDTELEITLFMELCDGNLADYILNKNITPATLDSHDTFNARHYFQSDILDLCLQTVKGLQQLHNTFGIIHRDMKPSNVLLIRTPQRTTVAKVADFGLSRELPSDASTHHTISTSTREYMAEECYSKDWKKASDIFALGILLYYAFTNGKHPFGEEGYEIEGNVRKKKDPKFDSLRNVSESIFTNEQKVTMVDLIKRMIKHDPKERVDINEVFHHPAFWNSRKKIEYLLNLRVNLRIKENKISSEDVNKYDAGLLKDKETGKQQTFSITEKNLPRYLLLLGRPRNRETHHLIDKCSKVEELLRVIRNQFAHALDPQQPRKLRKDYGVMGDKIDEDKFLAVFIKPYPQLLVHLYEFFRNLNLAADFYPSKSDQPSTSSRLPSVVAGFDSLTEWEEYYWRNGVTDNQFFCYKVTARYNGRTVKEENIKIKDKRLKIFYPNQTTTADTDPATLEFRMKPAQGSITLKNFAGGIVLRTNPADRSLIARRECLVKLFYRSHKHQNFEEMAQGVDVTLFSYEKLYEQLYSTDSDLLLAEAETEFVLGKNPNITPSETYPVTITIESIAAAYVFEPIPKPIQLTIDESIDEVLVSVEK